MSKEGQSLGSTLQNARLTGSGIRTASDTRGLDSGGMLVPTNFHRETPATTANYPNHTSLYPNHTSRYEAPCPRELALRTKLEESQRKQRGAREEANAAHTASSLGTPFLLIPSKTPHSPSAKLWPAEGVGDIPNCGSQGPRATLGRWASQDRHRQRAWLE